MEKRPEYTKQFIEGEKNKAYLDGYHGRSEKPKAIGRIGTETAMAWEQGQKDKAAGEPEMIPHPQRKAYVVPIGPAGRRRKTRKAKKAGKRKSRAHSRRR